MRCLLIVPRFQEPQNLKNSGCRGWTDFSRSWVLRGAVPLIRSAAWRNRTSKSFTDRMPSKHLQYHYGNTAYWLDESSFNYASDTEEHQPYTIKTRGIKSFFKATHLKKLVEMESNHPNPKTSDLQSEPLPLRDIHQCRRCVFTELSPPMKQVPWFFMCIPTTALTFGYSLSLPVLRKDTELNFTECQRMESNHFLSALLSRASDRSFQWATLT